MFCLKQFGPILLLCFFMKTNAQDTTALISGILGSLTSTSKNQGCPGECVHAITALLCEQTLSDAKCDAAYLRCCITKTSVAQIDVPSVEESVPSSGVPAMKPTPQPLKGTFAASDSGPSSETTQLGEHTEPDVEIKTINASNTTKPSSSSSSRDTTNSAFEAADSARADINCPGACISETFIAYCRVPLTDGFCSGGHLCCAQEDQGQTLTVGQQTKPVSQPPQTQIEKKTGGPMECPGSCVSSLFSLLCDKVDYTATCASGGVCCLNTAGTSTTTPPPPPAAPTCNGRCLPGFMHTTCRNQGNQVSTEATNCPPATICCLDSQTQTGNGDIYTNDRGPDGPGIILTGPPNVRPPFSPGGGSSGFALSASPNDQSSASNPLPSELFGSPHIIQEETVGPLTSAELVTKIARTIQCPGSCIAPLMKFTCFGSNNVFPHFKCGDGYVCCADTGDVKRTLGSAIILNQMGSLGHFSPPPESALAASPDGGLFGQRPSLNDLPSLGDNNKLSPSSEPQESQLQPINVRPPPGIGSNTGGHELLPNNPPNVSPPVSPPHSSVLPLPSSPPSQGGFVPAVRPRPGQHLSDSGQEGMKPLNPSTTPLSPPVPSVQGNRHKIPSYQITAPTQSSFLGSKNFNRPFRPIGRPETAGSNGAPVLTSGGFIPAGVVVSPISPSLGDLPTSRPLLQPPRELNTTRVKGSSREPLSCGRRGNRQQRVIGGRNAEIGDWCWQAAIYNEKGQYVCGGALIGPQWIVTAAHCVTKYVRNGDTFFVEVGSVDLTARHGHSRKKAWASYIHHNYNENTLDNDIALVKVLNPFNVNSTSLTAACTVCLPGKQGPKTHKPSSVPIEGSSRCTVTGYGALHEGGPVAMRIRQVDLPMVDERTCIAQLSEATEKQFKLPASTFCAGGEQGSDACQGDGGSPMVCDMGGFYELKGLVSWGLGCGRQDVPGVYVKVSSFIGWINQIISVNTAN